MAQSLGELDVAMKKAGVFVPHGQCANVHVGGHAQSGGYGSPARAFGLFGDHITAIRLFTADGVARWYARDAADPAEADIFWAVLGGGPGCFGVLTHIKLVPHLDTAHPRARGLKLVADYDVDTLRRLLEIKAALVSDRHPNPSVDGPFPADFDLTITVMSDALFSGGVVDPVVAKDDLPTEDMTPLEKVGFRKGGALARLGRRLAQATPSLVNVFSRPLNWIGKNLLPRQWAGNLLQGNLIIVWASWANLGGEHQSAADEADALDWLASVHAASPCGWLQEDEDMNPPPGTATLPMSKLRRRFVFPIRREFNLPFDKRTYFTAARDLETSGWIDATVRQIDDIVENGYRILSASIQIMHCGGEKSAYTTGDAANATSYSWRRDGTLLHVMDAFYQPGSGEDDAPPGGGSVSGSRRRRKPGRDTSRFVAAGWQALNDIVFKDAEVGTLSPGYDRRVLWGSYHTRPAERQMWRAWPLYHEDEAKYKRLCAIKRHVDPGGVFTANDFSDLLGPADGAGPALDPRNMRPGAPAPWATK